MSWRETCGVVATVVVGSALLFGLSFLLATCLPRDDAAPQAASQEDGFDVQGFIRDTALFQQPPLIPGPMYP